MSGNKAFSCIVGIITAIIIILILLGSVSSNVSFFTRNNVSTDRSNTPVNSYIIGKHATTLYQLKAIGSINDTVHLYIFRSIANKIISEYGKGLINSSFDPRYYVILYSSYKDYNSIMAQHNYLGYIKKQLDRISCRILASEMYLVIHRYDRGGINITLVFRKGIAVCGEKYRPLPRVDSSWIVKDGFYVAVFHYLNITKTIHVNMQTGLAFNNHGNFVGEWIFNLAKSDIGSNSTLLLYNVLPKTEMDIGNRTYSLANLIYVEKRNGEFIAKPIVMLLNKTIVHIGGLILMERIVSPFQNAGSCTVYGKDIRVENLPPFLVYRRTIPENKTLIMYYVKSSMLSRINHHKELMRITIIGKHEHVFKTLSGKVTVKHIIYGVKIQNNTYVAGLDLGLINITYNSNGELQELKMSVTTGLLYNALPMIIDDLFCIGYNSLVDASAIEISITEGS